MSADTSREAVERLAAFHALSVDRYDADEESGLRACAHMTAATLRALRDERDAARAERDRMLRVVNAARAYYAGYCVDEADSRECCVEDEQHEAAQELRDALAALGEPRA